MIGCYIFSCQCDSQCIGHTSQQLHNRICEHVPKILKLAKFQTLATFPLLLTNLQP